MPATWAERAAAAETAITTRHIRALWGLPGRKLGLTRWPATLGQRLFLPQWHYWWQAHLVDCAIDAYERAGGRNRAARIHCLIRGLRWHNLGKWINRYYDDIAWLGLALERADRIAGIRYPGGLSAVSDQLHHGWTDHAGGGIWWRRDDNFKNIPANGPAAILHARLGQLDRARAMTQWMTNHLIDPATGLALDGLHVNLETGETWFEAGDRRIFTYCQGVYIGACIELWRHDGDEMWTERAGGVIAATARHLTLPGGSLRGQGGGDGGLFTGILARYLAQAALHLPPGPDRDTARQLVMDSAAAAWETHRQVAGGPLFSPSWTTPAVIPTQGKSFSRRGRTAKRPEIIERDLSVQLSGWMTLESAALLERSG